MLFNKNVLMHAAQRPFLFHERDSAELPVGGQEGQGPQPRSYFPVL